MPKSIKGERGEGKRDGRRFEARRGDRNLREVRERERGEAKRTGKGEVEGRARM